MGKTKLLLENLIGIDHLENLGINWISDINICLVDISCELNWFTVTPSERIL
jgi:hypothetical protein